jgi:hypothetical protein
MVLIVSCGSWGLGGGEDSKKNNVVVVVVVVVVVAVGCDGIGGIGC